MYFKFDPLNTSDIITIVNIIATSVFSFLIWKATISSNKTAKAIKDASEEEKKAIQNQNRFLVMFNITKIENILLSHTIENGFQEYGEINMVKAIEEIKNFDLTFHFKENEIRSILEFIDYFEKDFMKIFRRAKVYPNLLHPSEEDVRKYKQKKIEYNTLDSIEVNKFLVKLEELNSVIK